MLGVVASVCTPLSTRTQQLSTLLEPTMLGVVASVCTPLPTRTQQLSTLLEPTMLGVVASVCTPLPTRTQQLSTLLEPTMLRVVAPVCTPLPTRTQQLLTLKMKNDHRSKFSNLSNWKEEAWKKIRASSGLLFHILHINSQHCWNQQCWKFLPPFARTLNCSCCSPLDFCPYNGFCEVWGYSQPSLSRLTLTLMFFPSVTGFRPCQMMSFTVSSEQQR